MEAIKNQVQRFQSEIEKKKEILSLPAVRESVSNSELRIAELGTRRRIAEIPDQDLQIIDGVEKDRGLVYTAGIIAKGIARDFAIRNIEKEDAYRFYDVLKKYYNFLTLDEVRTAFELALVGELDKYLPNDKNGNPDKSHYQSFSMEFITRILNAFKAYKGKVWGKVYIGMGKQEIEATPEEIEANRLGFLKVVQEQFESWKAGANPVFLFSNTVADFFIKMGIVEDREISKEDYARAVLRIKDSEFITGSQKVGIFENFRNGNYEGKLEIEAKRIKSDALILQAFENMKRENKNLI